MPIIDDRGADEGRGIVLTSTENKPGEVVISMYEKHKPGEPGTIMRHQLSLNEMQHLHEALTRALWWHTQTISC